MLTALPAALPAVLAATPPSCAGFGNPAERECSADFAARGYSGASHGCVNVRDEGKIASLFTQVRTGDKVVVHG